jgi:putative FmdB family regulatory protein
MPIYQYEPMGKEGCVACRKGFELRRPLDAPPLTQCPLCRAPVRKVISVVHSPRKLKPVSFSDAKKAGFTVLKRLGKGEYERQ